MLRRFALRATLTSSVLAAGCGSSGPATHTGHGAPPPAGSSATIAPPAFCARPGDDTIRDVFCKGSTPSIAGIADLEAALDVTPPSDDYGVGTITGASAVLLGHSTSLSGHVVSPLNPRAILPVDQNHVLVAFQRGVQRAEIAAHDRVAPHVNLYLVTFRQACNAAKSGCVPGDLYTPSIESGWTSVEIQDDEDLKNTPSDCRQCHQRDRDAPSLLMREFESPWVHFFGPESADPEDGAMTSGISGGLLVQDYRMAKGDEPYGGIPMASIEHTTGFALQLAMDGPQPLLYDSPTIIGEMFPYVEGETWPGPEQRSPSWDREYAAFKQGLHLALPYFSALAADPGKLSRLADAYQGYLAGTTQRKDLPDFSDVFPDDPQTRAEIGLQTEPDATPAEALVQACCGCHDDVLDQSITRARFNIALPKLDPAELAVAIERLGRSHDAAGVMPPPEARQLDPSMRERLIAYLKDANFSDDDSALLTKASALGMAGPALGATQ
ncbi:MAG TPA: hypothetical protein VH062_01530 [Polyangiaceae bacterium]|nr:hypothetical protein [Polyangiaceae bacterium]